MKRILIVEDDEKSLYLARFILEKEGYEVIEARDGLEALDNVSKETPDLILMDMQLPKLDGYEVTRQIKADERLSKIPVIALTAYAMKGDREKTLEAGCSGHIEKPIDPSTFVEEVGKYL
jgi:CheY-like chemotaxis protein